MKKRILGLLLTVAIIATQFAVLPAFAAAPTMTLNPAWEVNEETVTGVFFPNSNDIPAGVISLAYNKTNADNKYYFSTSSDATVVTEPGNSSNNVVQVGKEVSVPDGNEGTTTIYRGLIGNNRMYTDATSTFKTTNDFYAFIKSKHIMKWETKIKLTSPVNPDTNEPTGSLTGLTAYVLGYATNGNAPKTDWYSVKSDGTEATSTSSSAIKIKDGVVYIPEFESASKKVYTATGTSLSADTWYRIVRYIDFSHEYESKTKIEIYEVDSENKNIEPAVYTTDGYIQSDRRATKHTNSDNVKGTYPTTVSTYLHTAKAPVMIDEMKGDYVDIISDEYTLDGGKNLPTEIPNKEITFDAEVDGNSFNDEKITLTNTDEATPVDGLEATFADGKITIDFPSLERNTRYTLTIDKEVIENTSDEYAANDISYTFATAADFSVSSPIAEYADGSAINEEDFPNGKDIIGKTTVVNQKDTPAPYLIIVAAYKGNELLRAVTTEGTVQKTSAAGQEIKTTSALNVPGHADRIVTMVWKNWASVKPLVPRYELVKEEEITQ